jgi:hypothetical protein
MKISNIVLDFKIRKSLKYAPLILVQGGRFYLLSAKT